MAKEYFSLKNQVIEFDTDTKTMIVAVSDDKFKTISVNTMSDAVFNSQYLTFKAEVAKALVSCPSAPVLLPLFKSITCIASVCSMIK